MAEVADQKGAEAPRVERTQEGPRWGEKGFVKWRLLQAVVGERPEDKAFRKRIFRGSLKGGSAVTVVGLLVTAVTRLWLVGIEPMIIDQVEQQPKRDAAMLTALEHSNGLGEKMIVSVGAVATAVHELAATLGVKQGETTPTAPAPKVPTPDLARPSRRPKPPAPTPTRLPL